ncbi:MAG: ATP-binding protein [Ignavibacteriaceae bacterium]
MGKKFRSNQGIIILISIIIGIIMITSAYFEMKQSKEEVLHLLNEHAASLIETVSLSAVNTLNSSYEIEDLIIERLFNNAWLIRSLDSLNLLSESKLIEIGKENNLFRINIFNSKGDRVLSNRVPTQNHSHPEGTVNRFEEIEPILSHKTNSLIIGLKEAEHADEQRYAVAIARANKRGAIVINLDAKNFLEFRKKIGIGKIIQDIADNPGIDFIALQDTIGIIAASKNVKDLNPILKNSFLTTAFYVNKIYTRIMNFNGKETYEVVKRLEYENSVLGIFRVGLSLNEVRNVEARTNRRIIIISIILAMIAVIVLSILFISQNLKTVSNEFKSFKTLTGQVLENMGDAVIVLNKNMEIVLFNKQSEDLFRLKASDILNKDISDIAGGILIFIKEEINGLLNIKYFERTVELFEIKKYLSFSISQNKEENEGIENYTVVIKDLTTQKMLEEQAERNEKLSAMGELASGVAHEIRNPINSIGMIAQRLKREFEPKKDDEEYQLITKVLKDEVTRINKIISQFLNYAKPIQLQKKEINSKAFFEEVFQLFIDQANSKNISFELLNHQSLSIDLDPELIKQSLMNLIQNSFDAVAENGIVNLNYYLLGKSFIIEVRDDGTGISDENKRKIFDLYFSTKKDGNGLGLSISQKIISQHNGTIEIEDNLPKGTIFKIKIPKQ